MTLSRTVAGKFPFRDHRTVRCQIPATMQRAPRREYQPSPQRKIFAGLCRHRCRRNFSFEACSFLRQARVSPWLTKARSDGRGEVCFQFLERFPISVKCLGAWRGACSPLSLESSFVRPNRVAGISRRALPRLENLTSVPTASRRHGGSRCGASGRLRHRGRLGSGARRRFLCHPRVR